jgi:hypothetical protein
VVEASGFSNILSLLTGVDAFSLLFPFLLAWMLYYAMIEKSKIFDDTSLNNAPPIMAMLLAFFTARFLVIQPFYQTFFSQFFGRVVIGLASILGLFALLGMSGISISDNDDLNDYIKWIAAAMAGAAFIWAGGFGPAIFGPEAVSGPLGEVLSFLLSGPVLMALAVGGAMLYIMRTGQQQQGGQQGGGQGNP